MKRRVKKSGIKGTSQRPRLSVFKSNKHIYAQVIDDESGRTLAAASSLSVENADQQSKKGAKKVGELIAKKAREAKVSKVVFDRGNRVYHGQLEVLANAAREQGLEF